MRPLVPTDLYRLALPSDPRGAPDGRVFYVLATQNEPEDRVCTSIWCVRQGAPPRRFTAGPGDRSPRVSPDGSRLAFVRDCGDAKRLFVAPLDGGEAEAVSPSYEGIFAPAWSPDGRTLAFAAIVPLEAQSAAIAVDERTKARHIRRLPFKSDDEGLLDGRRKHLFVCTPGSEGDPLRLTFGDFDAHSPAWSPDGALIAFDAQIGAREDSFVNDIFVIPSGGGEMRRLTSSLGPMSMPAFSNDGREVAFIGHEHGEDVGGRFNHELLVCELSGGAVRSLSASSDRPVIDYVICDIRGVGGQQAPIWAPGDRELYVPLSSEGTCGITAFSRDGSARRTVAGGERDIFSFSRAEDGSLALVFSTPLVPSEVAFIDEYGNEECLTECNPWLAERSLRAPRRIRPSSPDGWLLDLFLLDPTANGPAPWVVQVHGGPHTAYGFAFSFEFQILAAHGIGVAYGNPRGSQTYGHHFSASITGNWGGVDAEDVLTMHDAALANAAIDRSRVGLAGGSYGGFMTTWLLGHTKKRFCCGVSMRAVNDFVSEVGAADLGWFLESEIDARWNGDGRALFEKSPMRNAAAIDVPLLIEHSERDFRCPVDQGEGLFTLLRRLGNAPCEFVRFTGDGHGLSRTGTPRNRVLRLRAIAHWFIRHLRPAGIEPIADEAGALFAPLAGESEAAAG